MHQVSTWNVHHCFRATPLYVSLTNKSFIQNNDFLISSNNDNIHCICMDYWISGKIATSTDFSQRNMNSLMFGKFLFTFKRFVTATEVAFVRCLSCVYSYMHSKIPVPWKGFFTVRTWVWFLSCVNSLMHRKIIFTLAWFITIIELTLCRRGWNDYWDTEMWF